MINFMMKFNNLDISKKQTIVTHIIDLYNQAIAREGIRKLDALSNKDLEENDKLIIYLVDQGVEKSCKETQLIIKNDYVNKAEHNWYLEYFSRSTYYRYKAKALDEFINCLNI